MIFEAQSNAFSGAQKSASGFGAGVAPVPGGGGPWSERSESTTPTAGGGGNTRGACSGTNVGSAAVCFGDYLHALGMQKKTVFVGIRNPSEPHCSNSANYGDGFWIEFLH